MSNEKIFYRYEGTGVLKKAVPVTIDMGEVQQKIFKQHIKDCEHLINKMLKEEAMKAGYASIESAVSYSMHPNPYQAEGLHFFNWRSACWAALYEYANTVKEDVSTLLTVEEIMKKIPLFV